MKRGRTGEDGRAKAWSLGAVAAAALAFSLAGLRWGLPSAARLELLDAAPLADPAYLEALKGGWESLHRTQDERRRAGEKELKANVEGLEEIPAGWTQVPAALNDSYRSFILRSTYWDEKGPLVALGRMSPARLDFNPHVFQFGGAFLYPLGVLYKALGGAGLIKATHDLAFYLRDPAAMGRVFVAGRLYGAAWFVAACLLLALAGFERGGTAAGLLAGLLYAACPAAVINAHVLKAYGTAAFWSLAALYLASGPALGKAPPRRAYLLSGLASGLAAGSIVFYGWCAAAPWAAYLERRRRGRAEPGEGAWLLVSAAVAGAAALAVNPYWLLARAEFMQSARLHGEGYYYLAADPRGLADVLVNSILLGAGPALFLAGLAGLGRSAWAERELYWPSLFLVGLASVGSLMHGPYASSTETARFFLPLLGILALMAGGLLGRSRRRTLLAAAVLLPTAALSAAYDAGFERDAGPGAVRLEAGRWINENVPAGDEVGLVYYPNPHYTPPFRWSRCRLVVADDLGRLVRRAPRWLVLPREFNGPEEAPLLAGYRLERRFGLRSRRWLGLDDRASPGASPIDVYRRLE